ncbi:MAG: PTS sugar transporter subunit IIA [Spirochaetia bacterium]|jgi:PTS system nitrogen regulatory IIA component|nr:PTS sugar transporter subunit IIA [Spirochaetia bacterium]
MGLINNLDKACIRINSESKTRDNILKEISELVVKTGTLKEFNANQLYDLLKNREDLSTTGIGMGLAIPHCSIEGINRFVVGLITSKSGIDFKSIDGKYANLIFFIIGPKEKRNEHIQILSSISKLSKTLEIIETVKNENSLERIYTILTPEEHVPEEEFTQRDKCMFNVFIQREDVFEDILEIFSAEDGAAIAVTETRNAGYYLHSMPLFSTFWSNDNRMFSRTITAVVNKSSSNNIVRRINMLSEYGPTIDEVMITIQDLFYTSGGISF